MHFGLCLTLEINVLQKIEPMEDKEKKPINTDLYKMKIHDAIDIGSDCVCLRVHKGWIYIFYSPLGGDGKRWQIMDTLYVSE